MNKARRHELKMLKYKKRMSLIKVEEGVKTNFYAYRSTSTPCSSYFYRDEKYRDRDRRNNKKIDDDCL